MEDKLLSSLISGVVKYPDDVRVEKTRDEMGLLLRLWVNRFDMGCVIGKKGANAQALKQVVKMFGLNKNYKVALKIEEPV